MGAELARSWLSLETRRRWRALLLLALLVAFATTVLLASVAGARRGASAVDRLAVATKAADAVMLPFQSDPAFWAKVRGLPSVEALTTFPGLAFAVDNLPDGRSGMNVPAMDTELFRTLEVPVLLDGRLPDPRRVDEVVVTSLFRSGQHKGVGSNVAIRLHTPARAAGTDRMNDRTPPTGPVVRARVVGVVRSSWFAENPGGTGGVITTPALYERYWPNIVGAQKQIPVEALVRLRPGSTVADLRAQVGQGVDIQDVAATVLDRRRQVDGYEATALLVFAGVAAVAACVLVGQAVARYVRSSAEELRTLRASGLTPRQQASLAAVAPGLAGVVGVLLGAVGALLASMAMPLGSAALHEPAPGLDFDPLVLLGGGLLVALLVVGGAASSAALAVLFARSALGSSSSLVARLAARLGLPVPVLVGLRFALEPTRAVSVRSALSGAVAGVLGVLAALTFAAGIADASAHPERFGQTQQLEIYAGFGGDDTVPATLLPSIARDPDVAAVNDTRIQVAEAASTTFPVFTYAPVSAPYPVVMSSGRLPSGPREVAFGSATAAALGVAVGDTVPVNGGLPMTVTGIGFLPTGLENAYTEGAWVTPDGYATVFPGGMHLPYMWRIVHLTLTPGADPAAVAARLGRLPSMSGLAVGPPVMPPPEVVEIRDIAVLPYLLGGFLAILALGAVGHALTTAVRRRGQEVGVLRALGLTPTQSRSVVLVQALVLALIGLLLGLPLGLALGRLVWHAVAAATPIQYVPPTATFALALATPLTLLLVLLLAAYPSRLVTRLRLLRTE